MAASGQQFAAANCWPEAAICYSEMEISGLENVVVRHKDVVGSPIERTLTHIERQETSMFRGLIRGSALALTSGLQTTEFESFGSFHKLMAQLALAGEFRLVDGPTYYKRLHGSNLHLKWYGWSEERRRAAWALLAAQFLEVIVPAGRSAQERWHLCLTVLDRFIVAREGRWMFCLVDNGDTQGRAALLRAVFAFTQSQSELDLPAVLEAPWWELEKRAAQKFGVL